MVAVLLLDFQSINWAVHWHSNGAWCLEAEWPAKGEGLKRNHYLATDRSSDYFYARKREVNSLFSS
jgi:hypothetical protein